MLGQEPWGPAAKQRAVDEELAMQDWRDWETLLEAAARCLDDPSDPLKPGGQGSNATPEECCSEDMLT